MPVDSIRRKHASCMMQLLATLSTAEAHQYWHDRKALLADIRHVSHFELAHVPGSIHLSDNSWSTFIQQIAYRTPIMVMCYHGISSQRVVRALLRQGFTMVYNIQGGFEQWAASFPHNIITPAEILTGDPGTLPRHTGKP